MSAADSMPQQRLTPDARKTLDELTKEYANKLVAQAAIEADSDGITSVDIVRSAYAEPTRKSATKRFSDVVGPVDTWLDRVLPIVRLIALGAFAASLPFVLPQIAGSNVLTVLVILSTAGIILFDVSSTIEKRIRIRAIREVAAQRRAHQQGYRQRFDALEAFEHLTDHPSANEWNFVLRWNELEALITALSDRMLSDTEGRSLSFGTILHQLQRQGVFTDAQADQIKQMLTVRNEVVHGGTLPVGHRLTEDLHSIEQLIGMLVGLLEVAPKLRASSSRTVQVKSSVDGA